MKRIFFNLMLLTFVFMAKAQMRNNSDNQKRAIDKFKELIEINTTSRFGSTRAAEAMAARWQKIKFEKAICQ